MKHNTLILIILGTLFIGAVLLIAQDESANSTANQQNAALQEVDQEYTYDADAKRDPFKKPIIGDEKTPLEQTELIGIAIDSKGKYVAILKGPEQKVFRMMVGDKLFNGEVLSIDKEKVVFKVKVEDEFAVLAYRTVTKYLHPEKGNF